MLNRKNAAVALAVCSMLASASFVKAGESPSLTLSPTGTPAAVTLDDAAPRGLLMQGMDKIGAGKTLDSIGLNIYGWIEAGYTANLRNNGSSTTGVPSSRPGPFTQEPGNHFELNQIDLRFERVVDLKKWDVGGMVEALFGTDSNYIRSNGIEYQTPGDNPGEVPQFEIPQAYIDIAIPVGNGIKVRAGKFVTLLGYETINPTTNPFYSHSLIFNQEPFTQTGVLGSYSLNDQWAFTGGITRGWDQATEDNNGAIDFLGEVAWTPNKKLTALLNLSVGPENTDDTAHYRTTIDPVITYQLTDALNLGAEVLYVYDGGLSAGGYGDDWGIAGYVGYAINDMFKLNGRIEELHQEAFSQNANGFEVTAGVTITPMPKDPIGSNLKLRPEIRYDYNDHIGDTFTAGNNAFKDNWTAGADVIFTY